MEYKLALVGQTLLIFVWFWILVDWTPSIVPMIQIETTMLQIGTVIKRRDKGFNIFSNVYSIVLLAIAQAVKMTVGLVSVVEFICQSVPITTSELLQMIKIKLK